MTVVYGRNGIAEIDLVQVNRIRESLSLSLLI
jgi:hypothetical protein